MEFNEKLLNLRKEKGLSQEELGEKLGVTRQTVSKWELGSTSPKLDDLKKLSELFNISIDELTGNIHDKENDIKKDYNIPKKRRMISKIIKIIIVIILVLYLSFCLYKFLMLNKAKKEINQAIYVVEPPSSYSLSYTHAKTDNIIEWRYLLFDGNNKQLIDMIKDRYIIMDYGVSKTDEEGTPIEYSIIYKIYDINSKTYIQGNKEEVVNEIFEDFHYPSEMFNEANNNIVPIVKEGISASKVKTFLFIMNPTTYITSNKDVVGLEKGNFEYSNDYYSFGVDKTANQIIYMRFNLNPKNKTDREDVHYTIDTKENFEKYISSFKFNEYTLVEE